MKRCFLVFIALWPPDGHIQETCSGNTWHELKKICFHHTKLHFSLFWFMYFKFQIIVQRKRFLLEEKSLKFWDAILCIINFDPKGKIAK